MTLRFQGPLYTNYHCSRYAQIAFESQITPHTLCLHHMASENANSGTAIGSITPPKRSTILLNSPELSKSPYLDPLKVLLDEVFCWCHTKAIPGKELLPASVRRLESGPQQLVSEIGPNGFCIIMFDGEVGRRIIATASAKPYKPTKSGVTHGSEVNMLFKRKPEEESNNKDTMDAEVVGSDVENQSRWELLAFATDVKLMGQGIAGHLTEMTHAEIRKRAAAEGKTKVVLMLSTMKEVNEPYYLKRGYKTMNVRTFQPGTSGSRDGFSVAEMVKVLE